MAGIKPVSLMGPNPSQPFDIQTEQARLQQAGQLAELMLLQSNQAQSPTVQAGPGLVMPNVGGIVGNRLSGMQAGRELGGIQARQGQLSQEYQQGLAEEIKQLMATRQKNPVAAVTMALQSRYPEIRKLGTEMEKGLPDSKTMMQYGPNFNPKTLPQLMETGSAEFMTPAPKVEFKDNKSFRVTGGDVEEIGTTRNFGPMGIDPGTGIPGQTDLATNEFHGRTGGEISTQNRKNLDEFTAARKALEEGAKRYDEGVNTLETISTVKAQMATIPAGRFGSLADWRLAVNRFLEMAGGAKAPETAGLEAINSALGGLVLDKIRLVAPVTEQDIKFVERIQGTTTMSKETLEQVLNYLEKRTVRQMERQTKLAKKYGSATQDPSLLPDLMREMYAPDFSVTASEPITSRMPNEAGSSVIRFDSKGNRIP